MLQILVALVSAVLFALGLLISGLADPVKVRAFLDISGQWDPSLALVMGSAIAVAALPFAWAKRHTHTPVLHQAIQLPVARQVDRPLLAGAAIFGVGWGLAGICPGPALVQTGAGSAIGILFVAAMLLGMRLHRLLRPA